MQETLFDQIQRMKNGLVEAATGGSYGDGDEYQTLRRLLCRDSSLKDLVPLFVRRCSDVSEFWGWIKYEKPTYAERRQLIWDAFVPLLDHLEFNGSSPHRDATFQSLGYLAEADINRHWQTALDRVSNDPEGAITLSRTILEGTCKAILSELEQDYGSNDDLPKLWKKCATHLNLSPSQHQEQIFKSILSNCSSIVTNLSTLRNKLGDAHVNHVRPVKPTSRHASLTVNLSGTMASFLVETWQARSN